MRRFLLGFSAALLLAPLPALRAQGVTTTPCSGSDGNTHHGWFSGETACEVRHYTLPLVDDRVNVAGTNGSIDVIGEDRRDIALEARITAHGSSHDDAAAVLHRIAIETHGTIHATGPTIIGWTNNNWSVSYNLRVPRHLAAELRTENGGIELTDLEGHITAGTTNGALSLRNLAGDVHATTVNGGVSVEVAGNQWHGGGLSAESTNGAISVKAPDHYSAHLVATTVNGGIAVAFPITVQGTIHNHLDTTLGSGGATLRLQTVNGGIAVARD